MDLPAELRAYLDTLTIHGGNIGAIRRALFVPWSSAWNGLVRDETAKREKPSGGGEAREVDRYREALRDIVRVGHASNGGDAQFRNDRMYRLAVEALGPPQGTSDAFLRAVGDFGQGPLDDECPRPDYRDDYLGITPREEPPQS